MLKEKLASYNKGKNNKKKKKKDRVPCTIALITNDLKFSYIFGMALRIGGYDNLSIYGQQSNWIDDISKNVAQKLVLIDTSSVDFARCTNLCENFILQEMKKRNRFRDIDDDDGYYGKYTHTRFCFLVNDKSVQTTYRNKLKANEGVSDPKPTSLPCIDMVERPFTMADIAATVNSQMLHLRAQVVGVAVAGGEQDDNRK